jgi:hypothetical protein
MHGSSQPEREERAVKHRRRLRIRQVILSALILSLAGWLVIAARSPSSGPIERILLILIAIVVVIHLVVWQLDGVRLLSRMRGWPKAIATPVALLMLAASPMVLYPLGALAVLVAILSGGGAAAPALTVAGLLMLSPIFAILLIALMFILSGYKGG